MSKIGIVIGREYSVRVKKKSFILTTLLVPILFAAMAVVPALIMLFSGDTNVRRVAVADESGFVGEKLENTKNIIFVPIVPQDAEEVKKHISSSDSPYYAVLQISKADSAMNVNISLSSKEQPSLDFASQIKEQTFSLVREKKMQSYNLPGLENIVNNIKQEPLFKTFTLKENVEQESEIGVYMALGYVSSFIIYMFILMFGSMVMRGIIEEKSNRIIEVIISAVKPVELMFGKIIGIALVALTQFAIWIALTGLIIAGVSLAVGGAAVPPPASEMIPFVENEGPTFFETLLGTFSQIDVFAVLGAFLIYFVLGYLLYSSMFAAVGSCVDNEADTQQLMMPVTIPLIIGLFIMLNAFQNPNSALAVWGSIIPFTSPMVMVARVAYGVPAWQFLLSVALLIITFLIIVWLSAKIFRIGILSYGRRPGWKELCKWLTLKD